MNTEQITELQNSLYSTFPSMCKRKEASFDIQNLVKHICPEIKQWLFRTLSEMQDESGNDIISVFANHKISNYILSAILEQVTHGDSELNRVINLML